MTWLLAEPAEGVRFVAEADGVWLRGEGFDISDLHHLRSCTPRTRLGRLLATLIPQLLELGLAVVENGAVHIAYADFAGLETSGIDAFEGFVPWAPFTIEIESSGSVGVEGFGYHYRFYFGSQVVHLDRMGCFVQRAASIYRLDEQTFALVDAIDTFPALPSEARAGPHALIRFNRIKGLAEGIGAQLDRYLTQTRVLVPSRIALDLIVENGGRITFAPKIDGAPEEAMRRSFLASDDVEEVYSLDHPEGAASGSCWMTPSARSCAECSGFGI